MSTDDKPKSAVELAMERMRKKDADSGVVGTAADRGAESRDCRGPQPSRVESGRARDSAPFEDGRPVRSGRTAARPKRRIVAIWHGFTTTSNERLRKYAARGIDFFVYISDNVLSHILWSARVYVYPAQTLRESS